MIDIKKAVVLTSGGLDSTTVLAMAAEPGVCAYTASASSTASDTIASFRRPKRWLLLQVQTPSGYPGGSEADRRFGPDRRHRRAQSPQRIPYGRAIPVTYVPARNTIFLSYALAWAEVLGAWDIFIGVNAVDYSGYPDCRPEYIQAFETMANLATKSAIEGKGRYRIHTPLIDMTKAQIILAGTALGVDYGMTHSCYDPSPQGLACGGCDSCILRRNGFAAAGVPDPTPYAPQ